jgi:rod shape determining protein RodA
VIKLGTERLWKDFDWPLLGAALLLSAISLTEIYSSTMNLQSDSFFLRQLAWVCVGVVSLFVIAAIDYHSLAEHVPWVYVGSLFALLYTLALGKTVSGSKSWVAVGPIRLQPSEMIKMVMVVALARYLSELRGSPHMRLPQIFKAVLICGLPMGLVALQPDLGTALTYLPALGFGLFIRGVRPKLLVALLLCFLFVLPVSWLFLKDYQKDRIKTFIHPEMDPLGAGYQVLQSKIAIGSGGFFGKGPFRGTQNQLGFLPTRHTDFIFSVVGEELGFAGVLATLGLLTFIMFRSVYHARTARDNLGLFIVMGIVGIYFFHVIVNIGMVIGFMPITGIPLPFMSYGGSSVLTAFIALGLVINVRRCRYVN